MDDVEIVRRECELYLSQIMALFKPHCKVTLLIRNPKTEDADLALTNDDFGEAIKALGNLKEEE